MRVSDTVKLRIHLFSRDFERRLAMVISETAHDPVDLQRHIHRRTGWRVRNLEVEIVARRAVLRGRATTDVTRQLAQQVVRDFLPDMEVENSIEVDIADEILPGIPMS
jgi:Flp pilus assembly secretin CpaC